MTLKEILDYEIRSSWWAKLIFWKWGQTLVGTYFAKKAIRKYKRYLQSKEDEKFVKEILSVKQ